MEFKFKLKLLLLNPLFRLFLISIYCVILQSFFANVVFCEGSWFANHIFINDNETFTYDFKFRRLSEEEITDELRNKYKLAYDFNIQNIEKEKLLKIPAIPQDVLFNSVETSHVKNLLKFCNKNPMEEKIMQTLNENFSLEYLHRVQHLTPKIDNAEFYNNTKLVENILTDLQVLYTKTKNPFYYYLICDLITNASAFAKPVNVSVPLEVMQKINDDYVEKLFYKFKLQK